ncbi:MAG: hypothetical protein ABIH66_08490, partial [bacterium]
CPETNEMDWGKILIITLAVTVVLFVPFYPFKLVKKFVFLLLNTFVPLPLKFDDIGGIPIVGIRLFNVRLSLGGKSTLTAREMRLRINLWRMLLLRRPSVDPVSFHDPVINLYKEDKAGGEFWFLFPLTIGRWMVGFLFASLWGLNKVVFVNAQITVHGRKGTTHISGMSGKFLAHGSNAAVRSMACRIGDGTIEMVPLSRKPASDVRVTARDLPLEMLTAFKVPRDMAGAVRIDAIMTGGFSPPALQGEMRSPCIYLRGQPIRNFHAPMRLEGDILTLEPMNGKVGDYDVTGSMEADVVTDRVRLKLHGAGRGAGPALIFQMLNMKPYLTTAEMDARVDLEGDFEIFDDISGEITIRLKDARFNPDAVSKSEKPGRSRPLIPVLNADLFMQDGSLFTDSIDAVIPGSRLHLDGRIDMKLDEEIEKVTETYYDLNFSVKDDGAVPGSAGKSSFSIPLELDGKFKLRTHQSEDSGDFAANGAFEMKNIRIHSGAFGRLKRVLSFLEIYFHGIRGDLDIAAKRVVLNDVLLEGMWLDILLNGEAAFDGAVDLTANVTRSTRPDDGKRPPPPNLPSWLASRLNPTVKITGTTRAPRVRLVRGRRGAARLTEGKTGRDRKNPNTRS